MTGGGATAITDLLSVPGASSTVIEASIPYHSNALSDYLGKVPDSASSAATARLLAMAAWMRGRTLTGESDNIVGLGATSALATDRNRRGSDRSFIALQTATATIELSLELDKMHRDRSSEERLVADLILHTMAEYCDVKSTPPVLLADEHLLRRQHDASPSWTALLLKDRPSTYEGSQPITLFPGAFNPIHHGHEEMILHASHLLQSPVHLEISIDNVDKPPIDFIEMADRQQSLGDYSVIFTCAPTFIEKARIFPGATFIIGADTAVRIADPKYYGGSIASRDAAIAEMHQLSVNYLVFGRTMDNKFRSLADLDLLEELRTLCKGVDQEAFHRDVSSSEIRRDSL